MMTVPMHRHRCGSGSSRLSTVECGILGTSGARSCSDILRFGTLWMARTRPARSCMTGPSHRISIERRGKSGSRVSCPHARCASYRGSLHDSEHKSPTECKEKEEAYGHYYSACGSGACHSVWHSNFDFPTFFELFRGDLADSARTPGLGRGTLTLSPMDRQHDSVRAYTTQQASSRVGF